MNRKTVKSSITIIIIVLSFLNTQAQTGSPYSQFGIGDLRNNSFGSYNAMGGIGIGLRTNEHLNIVNPASLSGLDSMTVIYELGLSGRANRIESDKASTDKFGSEIDYLAFGFRVNKFFATSIGLIPKSKVDYTFKTNRNVDSYVGDVDEYFHGNGGLNSIFWTNSFQINSKFSLGFEANFIFGAINNIRTILFEDQLSYSNAKIKEEKSISGFNFKVGGQYNIDLKNDLNLIVGATYKVNSNINAKIDTIGGAIDPFSLTESYRPYDVNNDLNPTYIQSFYVEELTVNTIMGSETKVKLETPAEIGFGFTLNKPHLFTAGADVEIQTWGAIDESQYNTTFNNSLAIRSGFEYIPDHDNINSYYKRIRYRAGCHYTKSHLQINDIQLNDYGISFGIGLPLRNTKTSFNITFEYGQRNTSDKNLLRETYGIVSLNLSLSDIWFVKRKFK